jgi:hypothetical protein
MPLPVQLPQQILSSPTAPPITTLDIVPPTAPPTSTATTTLAAMEEIPDDSLITCNVQQEPADVLIRLEVDTAEDVNTFNKELIAAMTDALLSSFAFCTASRRLAKRSLEMPSRSLGGNDSPDFALSAVSVIKDPSGKSRFDLFVFQLFLPSGFILTSSSFADP